MKRYEYKTLYSPKDRFMEKMNEFGFDGWELILVYNDVFYFKREMK